MKSVASMIHPLIVAIALALSPTLFGKNALELTKEERIAQFARLPVAERQKPEFFALRLVAENSAKRVNAAVNPTEIKLTADEELLVLKTAVNGKQITEFLIVEKSIRLNRTHIADCHSIFDVNGWTLSIKFTEAGGRLFGDVTENAVGRRMAMIVGGSFVLSAPHINEPIMGGTASISGGNLTEQDTKALASLFAEPKAPPAK